LPENKRLPHIFIQDSAATEEYAYPGRKIPPRELPKRDRTSHAELLLKSLDRARDEARARKTEIQAWARPAKKGVHLEFESEPGFDLELKSLDSRSPGGIRLVTVRKPEEPGDATLATVFVPQGKLKSLEGKIRKYAQADTKSGKPWHQKLVAKIRDIRYARLRSFWTDRDELFPTTDEAIWWEVWLWNPEEQALNNFRAVAERLGIRTGEQSLAFQSTRVLLAYGTPEQMSMSVDVVDSIAELRRAKEVASVFMEKPRWEMGQWVNDLLTRTLPPAADAPSICLLDTGVNAGHPLLQIAVDPSDLHAVDPGWRTDDHDGHGTSMAGLVLYGDLTEVLAGNLRVELPARIESVKILPPPPQFNDPELYGWITQQAVGRVEVERPGQSRAHVMAVSTSDGRDRGRPSSWSAAVDQLAYGGDGEPQRLWVLSAGNSNSEDWRSYPDYLDTEEIHDPGQAWNALTVGAFTERWRIEERDFEGWMPIARPGELSPSTTTSCTWPPTWPLKPDVVFEGGNAARSPRGDIDQPDSLSLLTTNYQILNRLLTTFGDTSAASALAAKMAAALQSQYPHFWPETIRALIVHSASWTGAMRERYGPSKLKTEWEKLIQRCGFGVPSLDRALWSADNRLTLVAQESLQPFLHKHNEVTGTKNMILKELHIYELPWPVEELRELGNVDVELRVTLSYFIEPNPSERGYQYRHRYSSHGFRFDVRAAAEPLEDFKKRLNKAAREEGERSPGTGDSSGWVLGDRLRHRGSLHADIWRGPAVNLANRQHIAVFPVSGWWKERFNLERWRKKARYSLVVSIHAPEIEVDFYTPVRTAIETPVRTAIEIPTRIHPITSE